MGDVMALTDRQLTILDFLDLLGPAEEGDVAYSIRLGPQEVRRVPPSFFDLPGEFIARRELKRLERIGLVRYDGVAWSLTPAGRRRTRM